MRTPSLSQLWTNAFKNLNGTKIGVMVEGSKSFSADARGFRCLNWLSFYRARQIMSCYIKMSVKKIYLFSMPTKIGWRHAHPSQRLLRFARRLTVSSALIRRLHICLLRWAFQLQFYFPSGLIGAGDIVKEKRPGIRPLIWSGNLSMVIGEMFFPFGMMIATQ